jgi:hypothetical protein
MDANVSRKRAFVNSESSGDGGYANDDIGQSADQQKNNKSVDAVQDIGLIPSKEAWPFDTSELLDSPTTIPSPNPAQVDGNNFKQYDQSKSIFLLSVIGEVTMQLDLLWYVS